MIDFNRIIQSLAVAYDEPMANSRCMVQKIPISPAIPMTNFNDMVQPFATLPIKLMISFNDRIQLFEIDFNAIRQPSPSALKTGYNGIMSIYNNHSTR